MSPTHSPSELSMRSLIESRLQQTFEIQFLQVKDDSDQHRGHAGHGGGGRHFTVKIQATELNTLSRIEAHRAIYAVFQDLMPDRIHALAIQVMTS